MNSYAYIAENLRFVQTKVDAAAKKGGYPSPTLVAATKYAENEEVLALLELGVSHIGENDPQRLALRVDFLARRGVAMPAVHMLGHLQSNKAKIIAGKVCLLHSLDRLHLAEVLEHICEKDQTEMRVLAEINSGKEPNKSGVFPEDAEAFIMSLSRFPHLKCDGLMTMAPKCENPEDYRPYFRQTRLLFEKCREKGLFSTETPVLSMGMSHSFAVAAEEGATVIRVGHALFDKSM